MPSFSRTSASRIDPTQNRLDVSAGTAGERPSDPAAVLLNSAFPSPEAAENPANCNRTEPRCNFRQRLVRRPRAGAHGRGLAESFPVRHIGVTPHVATEQIRL